MRKSFNYGLIRSYETTNRTRLTDRLPVIIRVDGKNFTSFTNKLESEDDPFSEDLAQCMRSAGRTLCDEIAGAQLAYIQSDEINLLITPYTSLNFEPFLDNRIQKLASITASIATSAFNKRWNELGYFGHARFDSRCFTLPKDEVCNYFIWRQTDWERNSIQMLGRYYFSHDEMHGLDNNDIQEKLWQEENVSWTDLDDWKKNGIGIRRETTIKTVDHPKAPDEPVERQCWVPYFDENSLPEFSKNRDFINDKVFVNDENINSRRLVYLYKKQTNKSKRQDVYEFETNFDITISDEKRDEFADTL